MTFRRERQCDICADKFLGHTSAKYCSDGCKKSGAYRKKAARPSLPGIGVTIQCGICSAGFVKQHQTEKYCSDTCRRSAQKNRESAWKLSNPDLNAGKAQRWRVANPEKFREIQRASSSNARRNRLKATKGIPYTAIEVFERDSFVCYLCETRPTEAFAYPHPESLVVEHVIPLSRFGLDCFTNVRCAHLSCNSSKRDRLLSELALPMQPPSKRHVNAA